MKKFDQVYKKIKLDINSRMFYEGILTPKNPYAKVVKFNIKDFDDFYDDIYLIKNNNFNNILSDSNILIETIKEVNFHQPVLDLFLNAKFGEQIMPHHILKKLNENWIYYQSYKEKALIDNIPIYVFKFDFNNDDEIFSMFIYLDNHFRKEDKDIIVKDFKDNCLTVNGFVKNLEKAILFCLNEPCSKQTIAHELCHYFQEIIHVIENKDKINVSLGIPELQLTKTNLQYLLNEKEFYPHIYIDMIKDFKKFYHVSFKDITKNQFLKLLFKNIEKYQEQIMYSDIGFEYLKVMKDSTSIQMLAALKYLNYKYDEVKEKIEKDF